MSNKDNVKPVNFEGQSTSSNPDQLLSELMDDQVSDEAIEHLINVESSKEKWFRYHLVRSVLKKEDNNLQSYQFTESVAQKIADEPAIIAAPKRASGWKKASGNFAIAASVAFATVFSVQLTQVADNDSSFNGQESLIAAESIEIIPAAIDAVPDSHEQRQLDAIQQLLDQMNQQNLNSHEQLVGGETMFIQSYIIEDNRMTPFDKSGQSLKSSPEMDER
ncbi:MAG: sigma-E factor negative regulatory protein [Gammaproteobacteria bacterium]|nr:sigma-E factor negative regulatory protein [Gammaproteobacteria bacterium]MDH5629933.1 sigma-E factor negative regulatory protein [Gammaproteobacteria bacterium]